jgi:hypothetical protein
MISRVPEKAWFEEWRDPAIFFKTAKNSHDIIGLPDLFLKRRWNYVLEAWAAGVFAELVGKRNDIMVRLGGTESQPDFYLFFRINEMPFELTELLEADRRRGDEYRKLEEESAKFVLFDPDVTYDEFISQIEVALGKKAEKRCNPKRHLLLYNNVPIFKSLKEKLFDIYSKTACFRDKFQSIWIMHDKSAVRTWPPTQNGNLRSVP